MLLSCILSLCQYTRCFVCFTVAFTLTATAGLYVIKTVFARFLRSTSTTDTLKSLARSPGATRYGIICRASHIKHFRCFSYLFFLTVALTLTATTRFQSIKAICILLCFVFTFASHAVKSFARGSLARVLFITRLTDK